MSSSLQAGDPLLQCSNFLWHDSCCLKYRKWIVICFRTLAFFSKYSTKSISQFFPKNSWIIMVTRENTKQPGTLSGVYHSNSKYGFLPLLRFTSPCQKITMATTLEVSFSFCSFTCYHMFPFSLALVSKKWKNNVW